ncbi:MAG: TAXI family TRAP transporter solute-binding subunit [Alphaproteobacteria bacterium]
MTSALSRLQARRDGDENGARAAVIIGGVIGLIIAAFVFAGLYFVDPAPPRELTIGSGSPGGFYDRLGQDYKKALEKNGLTVNLVPSRGSIENLARLEAGEVDIAFIQGGVLPDTPPTGIESLASIALEPLWIFTRTPEPITRLSALEGKRVAIGPEGSGTRRLAQTLFRAVGLDGIVTYDNTSGSLAVAALLQGTVDAVFFVTAPQTGTVQTLLANEAVSLARLDRAAGLTQVFPYLSAVTIPEGAFDLANNRPRAETMLVAPATTLLARESVHPALIALVLDVLRTTHGAQRTLSTQTTFPSPKFVELPLNEEARRYFEKGPTFLRRYLPFWAANLVERLWVLFIPLVTVMIPLFRVAPPAYRWQIRRRIYRWYDDLRDLEGLGRESSTEEERQAVLTELMALSAEVGTIRVPLAYTDDLYHLRLHIEFVIHMLGGTLTLNGMEHSDRLQAKRA